MKEEEYKFGDYQRKFPRKVYNTPVTQYKPITPLPPNTLRNADGSPYAAGHDSAIDQQKLKVHQSAEAYAHKLYDALCSSSDEWIDDGMWNRRRVSEFRGFLSDHLEEFALSILKNIE